MTICDVTRGDGPIILGQPHGGTYLPDDLFCRLNSHGALLADTDWHISRLYDGLLDAATVVACKVHRYVIDVNRDPTGASLYPDQYTTTLCPITDFDGQDIWKTDCHPTPEEIDIRLKQVHSIYHATLAEQIKRVQKLHGIAILFDCHSIRSFIPVLFKGTLPIFNIGTHCGSTCAPAIEAAASSVLGHASGYDFVVNGRFKGGWTTRHYGRPESGVHALQLELAQRSYMQETPPWEWRTKKATQLRVHLKALLEQLEAIGLSGELAQA